MKDCTVSCKNQWKCMQRRILRIALLAIAANEFLRVDPLRPHEKIGGPAAFATGETPEFLALLIDDERLVSIILFMQLTVGTVPHAGSVEPYHLPHDVPDAVRLVEPENRRSVVSGSIPLPLEGRGLQSVGGL